MRITLDYTIAEKQYRANEQVLGYTPVPHTGTQPSRKHLG